MRGQTDGVFIKWRHIGAITYEPSLRVRGACMQPKLTSEAAAGLDELGRVNRLYAVLSKVNKAIVRGLEPQELYEAACRIAVEDGHFILAWIGLVEPKTQRIRWAAKYGRDDGYLDTLDLSMDADVPEGRGPTGVALREGRVFINNDTEHNPVMLPWRDEQLERGYKSSASLPLRFGGRTVGVITLYSGEAQCFDDEEVRLLTALADDFSFALESAEVARQRAQVVQALQESHDELESRVAERTAALNLLLEERGRQANYAEALNRISESVHSTLGFEEIMDSVVVEITEVLGVDAAAVQTHTEGHWEVKYEHGLPQGLRGLPLGDDEVPFSTRVRETRLPLVVNDVALDKTVNAPLMETLGIRALMAVPLIMRDQVFGILLAERVGESAPFTDEQLDFLQRAGAIVALALENARMHETERDIADRLQGALISLPDAAVLTSLIKITIRAHATETGKTPSQVLTLTNEVLHKATPPECFATVFFGVLDRSDGRLVYASAGHTTAAVVRADGSLTRCKANGTIVGAFTGVAFGDSEVCLETDDLLFLYTDGLTEARSDRELYGEDRLFDLLASAHGSARDVVSDVVGDVVSFSRGKLGDDIAILAIKAADLHGRAD
jgi:GAF domain-containing protein